MSTTSLPKAESSQKVNVFEHNSTVDLPLCHVDPNWNSEHVVNFLQTDRVGSGSYCAGGKKSGRAFGWMLGVGGSNSNNKIGF